MKATERIRFGRFSPRPDTRVGRRLAGGALTITVTSRATGKHVTLRFRAKIKDAGKCRWMRCPFDEASHVFVESFDGDLIATYFPRDGVLRYERRSSAAAKWATLAVLRYVSGVFPRLDDIAWLDIRSFCGRCGQPLTDPVSIERGYGPECFGLATDSKPVPALTG